MTQQPQPPMTAAQSLKFLESYMDCTENLPLEIQRFVTQIREYDILYRNELQQITNVMILYSQEKSEQERKKHLNNVQKYLIKSQHYADEKISLITQMLDIAETRNIQVYNDAECINEDKKEEINNTVVSKSNNNTASNINSARMKMEKPVKPPVAVEKPSKTTYDKPKRPRRSKAVEKVHDRVEKLRAQEEAEKEEETEEIDDEESRQPRNNHKKNNNKVVKVKEQAEEKKPEKKPATKVTKKTNRQNGKNKKRKKEQELSTEEMAVDPDEPTYCLCNSISYGDMIGCDNDECQIEWFHFGCVSLTHKPKGKWYCPNCTTERKNKK